MSQEMLPFFETAEDATKAAIIAAKKEYKQVGQVVWPEKTQEAATTALRNALNPNREEKLTADQHILIANTVKQFHYVQYVCYRTMHAHPTRIAPADRAVQLQEQLFETAANMRGLLDQIDSLKQMGGMAAK